MKTIVILVLVVFFVPSAYGFESKHGLGTVTDLISDGTVFYYFEADRKIESSTWTPDTKIRVDNGQKVWDLSERFFMYPTELNQDGDHLYFAALSDSCTGQILCDYQDIYKMSKKDGSVIVLAKDLKSSVHISLGDDSLYVSESSGNIWKISKHGAKELVVKANEIIMDLTTDEDSIYWIEEVSDQSSNILTLEGSMPKVIAEDLKIPYDLTVQKGTLYWSEIDIRPKGGAFSEVTSIKSHDTNVSTLIEFQNTSPVSAALGEPGYGPYLVYDDYVFVVNNTDADSVIHMLNLYNSTKYDVGTISGYDAKYLRSDGSSLFVVGKNNAGFVIERYNLPVRVPEFPAVLLGIVSASFAGAIILQRFARN
jgi:hypothetical protein